MELIDAAKDPELTHEYYEQCAREIPKEDIPQMFGAEKFLIITDESGRQVSKISVKERIGVGHYLCLLHRAAFHGTAHVSLDAEGNQTLSFDCIQYFKDKKNE